MNGIAAINYDLPEELHRRAKAAAALRGQSLKDFLIEALEHEVERELGPEKKRK